jgi:carbon monoxide dehydrogenase subunit G
MSVQDGTHFTVKVNVGISYIKGVADVKMELAEAERPKRAQYKGNGSVAGGNVSLVAGFDLSANETGTKVGWQGDAQIFGRLTSVAGGLLEPLGKKQVQKLIDGLQKALT